MLVVALEPGAAARALTTAGAPRRPRPRCRARSTGRVRRSCELGADIGAGMPGEPAYYRGRVTDTRGRPVANCVMDVWSGDGDGIYDMQIGATPACGCARASAPTRRALPLLVDPADLLPGARRRAGRRRCCARWAATRTGPGHIHMKVYAPGHQPLTTHLFVADSPYLDSDAVFGVRDSLIVQFEKHAPGTAPDGRKMTKPYHTAHYDFRLVPKRWQRERSRCSVRLKEPAMKIGKATVPHSAICTSTRTRIVVRGADLCDELIGQIGFADYFCFLLTGRRPDAGRERGARRDAGGDRRARPGAERAGEPHDAGRGARCDAGRGGRRHPRLAAR